MKMVKCTKMDQKNTTCFNCVENNFYSVSANICKYGYMWTKLKFKKGIYKNM